MGRFWGHVALAMAVGFVFSVRAEPRADFASVQAGAVRYFIERAHPTTGLVLDKAPNSTAPSGGYEVASTAATGFGFAVLAHAAEVGDLKRSDVENQITKTLRFILTQMEDRGGWLYHFVNWETGARMWGSEISTIDTALLVGGALYAGQVFRGTPVETLAGKLYERLDFNDMLTDGGALPEKHTLTMGWTPEFGYFPWQWDSYAEQTLLLIMGMGHPRTPLPLGAWTALKRPRPDTSSAVAADLPLFVHQYSHLFLDLKSFQDGLMDYFQNSVEATRYNRALCLGLNGIGTFREGFWGLSASNSARGYRAYSPSDYDETVCPGCAIGSALFDPTSIEKDLKAWSASPHFSKIWGRYGFADSINLDHGWFDSEVIGITIGAAYMSIADLGKEPFWTKLQALPAIADGLRRAKEAAALGPAVRYSK